MDDQTTTNRAKGRKFLIVLLVVALVAFEVMRELYVLEVNRPVQLMGPSLQVYGDSDFAQAEGVWRRSDGGSPIMPGTVVIECFRKWGSCIEVNNTYMPGIPLLDSLMEVQPISEFSDRAVAYEQSAECVDYQVRIDLAQKRVIATRDKKPNLPKGTCDALEDRVVMEMVSGDSPVERVDATWTKNHFLPIYRALLPLLR
jgi:hypothetical protein